MRIPAVFDHALYSQQEPPGLGTTGDWALFWNDSFADRWRALSPAWRLPAAVHDLVERPRLSDYAKPLFTGAARGDGFAVACRLNGVARDDVVMTGATRVLAAPTASRGPSRRPELGEWTTARVVRMRSVVFALGLQVTYGPFPHGGGTATWEGLDHVPGSEEFTELTEPPAKLRHWRPPADDLDPTHLELLLLDLETDC